MLIETLIAAGIYVAHPSSIRVPEPTQPASNSVHFYDKLINVTNRVLDRSIYLDVRRVHTNLQTGEIHERSEVRNRQAVEEHCRKRLEADDMDVNECGNGIR